MIFKGLYRTIRTLLVVLLVLPLAVPALLYIFLSVPVIQKSIGTRAEKELSNLLGTPVRIGKVEFYPFNRIALTDVNVKDPSTCRDCLHVGHLGLGVSLSESLWNRYPVITYAELLDVSIHIQRDSLSAPLNISPIIERLKGTDTGKETPFHLAVNMVVIRRSAISYDVTNIPEREDGVLDPYHLRINDLRADLRAPYISNTSVSAQIKRLGASDQSGLTLSSLSAQIDMSRDAMTIGNLSFTLPNSQLQFDDITLNGSPLVKEWKPLSQTPISINLLPGAHISTEDISPLLPILHGIDRTLNLQLRSTVTADNIDIERLSLSDTENNGNIEFKGDISDFLNGFDSSTTNVRSVNIALDINSIINTLGNSPTPSLQKIGSTLTRYSSLGVVNLLGHGNLSVKDVRFDGSLTTLCGDIDFDSCTIFRASEIAPVLISGKLLIGDLNPSGLNSQLQSLTKLSATADFDLKIERNGDIYGTSNLKCNELEWDKSIYYDLSASADFSGNTIDASFESSNPGMDFRINAGGDIRGQAPINHLHAELNDIKLSTFVTSKRLSPYSLKTTIDATVQGRHPDDMTGIIDIDQFTLTPIPNETTLTPVSITHASLSSVINDSLKTLTFDSTPINLSLKGRYTYASIISDVKGLISNAFPSVIPHTINHPGDVKSDAALEINLHPDTTFYPFFGLPIEVIYPISLKASTDSQQNTAELTLDAPYLKQKDKLIENTSVAALLSGSSQSSALSFTTRVPTKNGPMDLHILSDGSNDSIITAIGWNIDAPTTFKGDISLATNFNRIENSPLETTIKMLPSRLIFNDSVWTLNHGSVKILPGRIDVSNLGASRAGQSLSINGTAGADSLNRLEVHLDHIDLDYVFSTLALSDAVNFGGIATGVIYGDALLSHDPVLYTPDLHVEGITYNHCTFGDADIHSRWDNNTHAITIDADIVGADNNHSTISGNIEPLNSRLDFTFNATKAPASFMLPFMQAFTSQVDGFVSGKARLFGTFKDLDLEGDIYAEDLSLKLDFTNTVYTVSDSVHIRPGSITFEDVIIKDRYDKTARLTGHVGHSYFHDPTFKFNITDAKDLLVYDVKEGSTPDPWYGTIYGNGGATVTGVPGKIDIDVKMNTAPKSIFTFVLSDEEVSVEHDFVTFRDRDRGRRDSLAALDPTPLIVKQLRDRVKIESEGAPTVYDMKFDVGIDSLATLELVMDPNGGDKISAHGRGNLLMRYASDGDLTMHGEYTLSRGTYRFTLQDIIIKDFNILAGSRITFLGDPYAAQLDIRASHSIKANLSDLDESFLEDRALTSTSVRVNALMYIRGDMRHPDLKFDLSFPTLTADTERKIRSIISTDEMMSQQILYLLALERFYTPEYMGQTAHGGELVSVASSTLSSRLSSMLGELSDSWTIAPAIRSDRGDFSDVQVDVALSSQLLDNRLLFNGNLGYRDKSLNNNSFIGDFDIRYLLNRSGSIQLKAYNRYNDQNYYLKSALTTQGIGVVFRRDFDNIFSFLRPLRRKKNTDRSTDAKVDSVRFNTVLDIFSPDSIKLTDSISIIPTEIPGKIK